MPDKPQFPVGGIPEECKALMKQLQLAALMGNFNRCMELQQFTNYSLKKHGLPAPEFPVEYFQLLHQMFDPAMQQDQLKLEDLGTRLIALQREAGVEDPTTEQQPLKIEYPEEYQTLQKKAGEAFESKDWSEFHRLVKESEAILNKMGIFNLGNIIHEP